MSSGTLILIVVGIGIVLIVLSFITRPSTQRHYEADIAERQRRFKEHGVRFEAYITEIQKKRGRDIGPLDVHERCFSKRSYHV